MGWGVGGDTHTHTHTNIFNVCVKEQIPPVMATEYFKMQKRHLFGVSEDKSLQ